METLILDRDTTSDKGTFGQFMRNAIVLAQTCELPWRDNKYQLSCIPKGVYLITPRFSQKYGAHWLVNDVEDRSDVLIHYGNTILDILGCILVGATRGELVPKRNNPQGLSYPAVLNSKATLERLVYALPRSFNLQITGVCG